MKGLLADVPQSRMFDEMLKLLQTGHALASIDQLKDLGLAQGLYPLLDVVVQRADQPLVRAALLDTDRRVGEGKPVAPSFLLACVLWADVREGWARHLQGQGRPAPFPALQDAIDEVFHSRIGDVSGGGKLAGDMREIWLMQPRFEKRTGSTPFGLVDQPRFRAAFDFMRLRAETGEVEEVLSDWWQEFSVADDNLRRDMVDGVRLEQTQNHVCSAHRARRPRRGARAMHHHLHRAPRRSAQRTTTVITAGTPSQRRSRTTATHRRNAAVAGARVARHARRVRMAVRHRVGLAATATEVRRA